MATIIQKFLTILLAAAFTVAFAQNADADRGRRVTLSAQVDRDLYGFEDTVVVGVKASIPRGYHLYANPLGPGIGKPLELFINRTGKNVPATHDTTRDTTHMNDTEPLAPFGEIIWFEARKSTSKQFNAPAGDWVWAYEREAYFFVKGIVGLNITNRVVTTHEVIIDALICRTDCIPIRESVPFELRFMGGINVNKNSPAFQNARNWQTQYAKSETMEFKTGTPGNRLLADDDGNSQLQLGIDLSGLSTMLDLGELPDNNLRNQNITAIDSAIGKGNDTRWEWEYAPVENKREYNLLTAILFAILAGLALNLTPCVFPVLSIRVLSFAESADEPRQRAIMRSISFACGMISVFLLLATLAAFAGFSWGQQFQNPAIMAGIIAMIFLFALGMFDFYTVTVPSAISNAERKASGTMTGDFLKGAAATVMATPCGGPFLGALLAWGLLQKPLTIFILFTVMGAGMASPYILLSSNKRLLKLLPKPGRWIEDFRHIMGFVLLIFAVGLLKALDSRITVTTVGICLSILCAASIKKRFAPFGVSAMRRFVTVMISIAVFTAGTIISAIYLRINIPNSNNTSVSSETIWTKFSPQALITAQKEGHNVIVNFTADWCTNCKLNNIAVLNIPEAQELYIEKNILLLSADITYDNPQARDLLHHLGSRSIPFIAIFPSNSPKEPVIMRDIFSKRKFLTALRELP